MPQEGPTVVVSVRLKPETLAVVDRFATALGSSQSAVIRGVLESSEPMLLRAAERLEAAARSGKGNKPSVIGLAFLAAGVVSDMMNAGKVGLQLPVNGEEVEVDHEAAV